MVKPVSVKPLNDYLLDIVFSTGERRVFDLKPYFTMKFYASLKSYEMFRQVYVGEYTVEWSNGCDIAPHELYDNSYDIMSNEFRLEIRRFFGTIMLMLGERGYSRAERKKLIRDSGLIEKCRDYDSATYVLHYNVEDWCDYMVHGNKWPRTAEERKLYSCWN